MSANLPRAWPRVAHCVHARGRHERGKGFSIVDRTSLAVMQRLGVHHAASFERDFAIYRFGPARRRSFTVLP